MRGSAGGFLSLLGQAPKDEPTAVCPYADLPSPGEKNSQRYTPDPISADLDIHRPQFSHPAGFGAPAPSSTGLW